MREFVYGTADQYRKLDQALSSGKNYRFPNRRLPRTCTPETACLWFGKVNGSYRLCIDKGIRATEGSDEFMRFLITNEELNRMALSKRLVTPTRDLSLDPVYTPFAQVPADRTMSPEVLGILDPLTVQIRQAAFQVGRDEITVDEAVTMYGSFK